MSPHKFIQVMTVLFIAVMTFFTIIFILNGHSKEQLAARTYHRVSGTVVDQYKETNGDGSWVRCISVIEYKDQKYEIVDGKFYMLYRIGDEAQFNIVQYYNDEGILVDTKAKTIGED